MKTFIAVLVAFGLGAGAMLLADPFLFSAPEKADAKGATPTTPITFDDQYSVKDWKAEKFVEVNPDKDGLDVKTISPEKGWVLAVNDGVSPLWRPIRGTGLQTWGDLGLKDIIAGSEIRVTFMVDPQVCDGVIRRDSHRTQRIKVPG